MMEPVSLDTGVLPLTSRAYFRRHTRGIASHLLHITSRKIRRTLSRISLQQIFVWGVVVIFFVIALTAWDLRRKWFLQLDFLKTVASDTATELSQSVNPLLWNMDHNAVDYAVAPLLRPGEIVSITVSEVDKSDKAKVFSQYSCIKGKGVAAPYPGKLPIVAQAWVTHDGERIGKIEVGASLEALYLTTYREGKEVVLRSGLIVIIFLGGLIVIAQQRRMTMRLEESRNRVRKALEEVKASREEVEIKHQQILSSIQYGRVIQTALLPQDTELTRLLPGSALLFLPRDIVSGDFYWVAQGDHEVFVAVVDCTGHGVPGAFMSMIGVSLLNQIVKVERIREPSQILNRLHWGVREALQQQSSESYANDGMDVCFCRIEKDQVTFAGAHRPLYYFTQGKLEVVKGSRRGIGGGGKMLSTTDQADYPQHRIEITSPTFFYLTTDGLVDQPTPSHEKFSSRRLHNLFSEIGSNPLADQLERVRHELQIHQEGEPQRDDITVLMVSHDPRDFDSRFTKVNEEQ